MTGRPECTLADRALICTVLAARNAEAGVGRQESSVATNADLQGGGIST
jgi:hypothetical protein